MAKHTYWGKMDLDWAGFSSDIFFSHSFFGNEKIMVFLGEEFDEEGEEIEEPPTTAQLDDLARTYKDFIDNIDQRLADLQKQAFDRYKKHYAHYYEDAEQSGEAPLGIDTVEKHNDQIRELMYFRITAPNTIRVSIRYQIDTEHGLEFKFDNGQITNIGGIAET